MAARALRIPRAAHFGSRALRAGPCTLEKQIGTLGLVNLLVSLQSVPPSKILAARWTFMLLIFGVYALVPL